MRLYLSQQNLIFISYSMGFFFGWVAWLSRAELLLSGLHNEIQVGSLLALGFCATLFWWKMSPKLPKLPMTKFKLIGCLVMMVFMSITAFPLLMQYAAQFRGPVVRDITVFAFILSGPALGVFSKRQRILFGVGFSVCLLIGLAISTRVNPAVVAMAATRSQAFDEVGLTLLYSFQVGVGGVSAMLLLYFVGTLRNIWLTLLMSGGALFWLYTSLIYSKRQGMLEFAIVASILFLLLIFEKRLKGMRIYLAMTAMVALSVVVVAMLRYEAFNIMLDRVLERFMDIQHGGLENFDRIAEATYYIEFSEPFRVLVGHGMGGFSFSAIAMHSLHLGWANLIFKGGIFLALFYLVSLSWNIIYLIKHKRHPNRLLALFFSAFCMLHLCYSPLWGFVPPVFWIGLAFFGPEVFLFSERFCPREEEASGRRVSRVIPRSNAMRMF